MVEQLRARVDAALADFVSGATPALDSVGTELHALTEAAARFVLDSGKRLRPAFCYWGARAAGMADSDALVRAAASLELLQACALIHDDVIDRSATRRGQAAVHEQFATLHRGNGWSGDPAAFGTATAILLGDLFLVWSGTMLATSGLPADALVRAQPVGDTMRVELMAGQYLDVVEQATGDGSVTRALRVARYKAAKYTVERPLHLGVVLAGGSDDVVAAFSEYGLAVGEAFQLRDDLLGVFGDPAVTGKPAGDDLREGKRTVLVALALESASAADRKTLEAALGDPDLQRGQVDDLRRIVTDSGSADRVETMISERVSAAIETIETAPIVADARDALIALAAAATHRSG